MGNVLVIADCCHSGSMIELPYKLRNDSEDTIRKLQKDQEKIRKNYAEMKKHSEWSGLQREIQIQEFTELEKAISRGKSGLEWDDTKNSFAVGKNVNVILFSACRTDGVGLADSGGGGLALANCGGIVDGILAPYGGVTWPMKSVFGPIFDKYSAQLEGGAFLTKSFLSTIQNKISLREFYHKLYTDAYNGCSRPKDVQPQVQLSSNRKFDL